MPCPCSAGGQTARACRGASCATCRHRPATASAWTTHGMTLVAWPTAATNRDIPAASCDRSQLAFVVGVLPERAHGFDGVGFGGGLVFAVTQDAREPQRHAARVAAAGLHAVERDLCHEFWAHAHYAVWSCRSRVGFVGQRQQPL